MLAGILLVWWLNSDCHPAHNRYTKSSMISFDSLKFTSLSLTELGTAHDFAVQIGLVSTTNLDAVGSENLAASIREPCGSFSSG